jgi:ATP-dependent RNA helicase DHX57
VLHCVDQLSGSSVNRSVIWNNKVKRITADELTQNFISATTVRDITTLRTDFLAALSQIGFLASSQADVARYSTNSSVDNLVKAVIVGGLYPRIARIAMPKAQFERIQQGAVQKDVSGLIITHIRLTVNDLQHEAKEVKLFDKSGRVFLHPSSILFAESGYKGGFMAYFAKAETSKVFLRDATEVSLTLESYIESLMTTRF